MNETSGTAGALMRARWGLHHAKQEIGDLVYAINCCGSASEKLARALEEIKAALDELSDDPEAKVLG